MSDPAVKDRLDKAVEFLEAILAQQLGVKSAGAAVGWAGRTLTASDGTCIRERGITINSLLQASANVHRRLAHSRRKRRPHIRYPVKSYFNAYGAPPLDPAKG